MLQNLERRQETRVNKLGIPIALAVVVAVLVFSLFGVALAADPTAEATRTIDLQVVERGDDVEVTVDLTILPEDKSFGLVEVIPDGWEFTRGTDDALVFTEAYYPEINWAWLLPHEAGVTKVVTYTVTVPMDAEAGNYTIEGTVMCDEVENPVDGDNTITVRVLHDLTTSSTAGGSVSDPGEDTYTYDYGTVVNLVATPDTGYHFSGWTGDTGTIGDVNAASTTITMNADYSITANFEIDTHTLTTASTAGGSVTDPGEDTYTYDYGTVVNLVATPDTGYHFSGWTGDTSTIGDVNAASTTITMNADYSITANFEIDTHTLTTASTAGGSVTDPGEDTYTYDYGTVVNLVATPDAHYHFTGWAGDTGTIGDVNAASTTITMNGDYSITADFEIDTHTLTTASTAGGSVTDPGEDTYTYDYGTVVNLVATPDAHYHFTGWTGDTGTIGDANAASTTITMNGDYSVTANFCELSSYRFAYDIPEQIVACEDAEMPVTFQTDVLGCFGCDNVRYKFYASGPGDVTFKVTDPEEVEHTFVDSGYWELEVGLDLPADYSETNNWALHFSTPGGYTVTFSLVDATTDDIVADLTESQPLTVEAGDILQYYRSLHEPIDVVTIWDLLAAADDFIAGVAMPCFGEPITFDQLLFFADEWIAGG